MVEAYGPGAIVALDCAAKQHRTAFIKSPGEHEKRYAGPKADEVLSHVERVVTIADATDVDQLERALGALHAEVPIDAVFSLFHPIVLPLSRAAQRLGIPFTDADAVELASRKHLARARLVERGIPSIRYATVNTPAEVEAAIEHVGFPLVVKPSGGVGKSFAVIVQDRARLDAAVGAYFEGRGNVAPMFRRGLGDALLLEEYMEGRMLSAEVASAGRASPKVVLGIEIRRRAKDNEVIELATSLPAPLSPDEEASVRDYVVRVVEAIGLDIGIFHIEIMLTAAGPRLIEANPRIGGVPKVLAVSAGIDVYQLLVDCHLQRPIDLPILDTKPVSLAFLASRHGGTIPTELDVSFTQRFKPHLLEFALRCKPGDIAAPVRGNSDNLGAFMVTAATHAETLVLVDQILDEAERMLGFELAR